MATNRQLTNTEGLHASMLELRQFTPYNGHIPPIGLHFEDYWFWLGMTRKYAALVIAETL